MRRLIALMLAVWVTSGCVATQRKPPENVVAGLRVIAIVPVEAPPLLIHYDTQADRAAMVSVGLPDPQSGETSGGKSGYAWLGPLLVTCPLCAAVSLPSGLAAASVPRTGETVIMTREPAPPWMPTTRLASRAAQLLQQTGKREVFLVDGYAQLPIEDRSVNYWAENWMAPVRRWYNADVSSLQLTQQDAPRSDAILEVGVLNYEYDKRLMMQVVLKLIDPTTHRVLGRARNWAIPEGKSVAEMLQDQGQPLRHLVDTTGEDLLTKCLQDLGLIPR